MRQDNAISYADLEKLGWPQHLIDDYEGLKRELVPQTGPDANPNGIYTANLNGMYIEISPPGPPPTLSLWYNPAPGASTGWVQIA